MAISVSIYVNVRIILKRIFAGSKVTLQGAKDKFVPLFTFTVKEKSCSL